MKDGGYLMVDHRASPGLPEDVARNAGYDPKHCGEGKLFEAASLTCSHCKCAVVKNPLRQRERSTCPKCNFHYICDLCAAETREPDYTHSPFDKIVDVHMNHFLAGKIGPPPESLTSRLLTKPQDVMVTKRIITP